MLSEQEAKAGEKALRLFSHILNAQHIWNCRIAGTTPLVGVWDLNPAAGLADKDRENYRHTNDLLDYTDLETPVDYKTSGGASFTNNTKDILFHIINHSTYHRGQVASLLRTAGIDPPATDYIFYKR